MGNTLYIKWLLLIIVMLLNTSIYSQLKISAGGGIKVHMTSGESSNSFSGAFDKNKAQQIGQFFDEAYIYALSASYIFGLTDSSMRTAYIAGFEYSSGVSKNLTTRFMPFLGEDLTIASYSPFLGIGFRPKLKARNLLIYITAGISYKTYKGEYKPAHSDIAVEPSFDNSIFTRFGLGADYKPSKTLPLVFNLDFALEFGKVKRGSLNVLYKGELFGVAYPTGLTEVPDNSLLLKLSACYLIDL